MSVSKSGEIELLEILKGDRARSTFVALSDEIHHIVICGRERQVLSEHGFDLLVGDELAIALIEQAEALLGFFLLAGLRTETLVPMVGHDVLDKLEIDAVTIKNAWVTLLEFLLDVTGVHLVEPKVL